MNVQIRNRVFWGSAISSNSSFKTSIDPDNRPIDLSTFLIEGDAFLFYSEIDRANVSYSAGPWDITIGRQRVNWGKNLVWNPNDLFNAYNFLDVDYGERPGSDAINIEYFLENGSSFQTVYAYGKELSESIIALRYQFNYKQYDIQILTANYLEDIVIGTGWEGYIGNASFKGEMSFFTPKSSNEDNSSVFTSSLSGDYFFKNGLSLVSGILYTSSGIDSLSSLDVTGFSSSQLSPKQLMPNRWSGFTQLNYLFNSALTGSTAIIYAHELKAAFVMPTVAYAIKENWDIDFIAQLFLGYNEDGVENVGNIFLLRIRYSY